MKKVAFLTIHVGFNFGSVLQSIATKRIIESLGYSPILINYIPDRVTYARYFNRMFSGIIPFVKKAINLPNFIRNNRVYGSYLSKYCTLSSPIYDKDDFAKKCPLADFYVTGSDQVWNSKHNEGFNDRYYFAQLPKEAVRVSFASSIGETSLSEEHTKKIRELLSNYKAISVREESAKKLIEDMGLQATHLLDPTFMLKREEWKDYMNPRIVNEDYLLIYTPYNTVDKKAIFDTARAIAKEKGLKIVTFSWNWQNDKMADRTIKYASPGDFLSLMYHADYVVTNSFHGTAFSVNLNKQFCVFMPSAFSTRISSIIELCGLQDRMVSENISIEQLQEQIDYTTVNGRLDTERLKSIEFLKQAFA
ncbi:MAG: polysaccharide pyruvyl transferase family protein [Bacteroidaceae bacterium]|nr:polysaccharide pyruvyl transferase family protein [Bacteroidaceae bacterium]